MIEAGRDLDRLVAEKVMGWRFEEGDRLPVWGGFAPGVQGLSVMPHYSSDMNDAWLVVERLTDHRRDDWCTFDMRRITDWHDPTWGYDVRFGRQFDPTRQLDRTAWAPTAPLAICQAALKALGISDER